MIVYASRYMWITLANGLVKSYNIYMDNTSDKQIDNSNQEKPWLWKKGQSGNLKGRPKGMSMKEYARDYLNRMTDKERDEWLDGLPKEIVWRMGEGNPKNDTDITSGGKPIIQLAQEIVEKNEINTIPSDNR